MEIDKHKFLWWVRRYMALTLVSGNIYPEIRAIGISFDVESRTLKVTTVLNREPTQEDIDRQSVFVCEWENTAAGMEEYKYLRGVSLDFISKDEDSVLPKDFAEFIVYLPYYDCFDDI